MSASDTREVQGAGAGADEARDETSCEVVLREVAACSLDRYVDGWVNAECGGDASCAESLAEVVPGRVDAAKTYWEAFCGQVEHTMTRGAEPECEPAVRAYLDCRRRVGCHDFFGEYFDSPDPSCAALRERASAACSFM
ncbi:MAG: hypothetical protein KF901_34070 [Myxococcales bacterium]|nr:hypothetical protein [Myxococcales bacterium]